MKSAMANAVVLAYPDNKIPFEIHPYKKIQRPGGTKRPLAYASRLMVIRELNYYDYSITEKNA